MVDEGRTSGFDMALLYALGKLKLCNVERKEQQRVVLEHIYNGNDVSFWLPTEYGKSQTTYTDYGWRHVVKKNLDMSLLSCLV